jgi:hypothetical protein
MGAHFGPDYGGGYRLKVMGLPCMKPPYNKIWQSPFGKTGDLLCGKETWRAREQAPPPGDYAERIRVEYRAGGEQWFEKGQWESGVELTDGDIWRPSIHMPKWASRIALELVDVRLEWLRTITEEDAIKEGVGFGFQTNAGWPDYQRIKDGVCEVTQDTAKMSFATLWDYRNKKPGLDWNDNPVVWALTVKQA